MSSGKKIAKSEVHILLKEDIEAFYENVFPSFDPSDVRFSINDIIANLNNVPQLIWQVTFEEDDPSTMS